MRILLVEDEGRMAHILKEGLTEEGHSVVTAGDGGEGLSLAQTASFDLVILDVMLPVLDGFGVVRRLRAARVQTPVLMLTARDAPRDVVTGLDLGADDYLTKPFSFEVLLARVRAVARRGPIPRPVRLSFADLSMDAGAREVRRGGRIVHLTKTEYAILELLLRNAGRVVTRERLIECIWEGRADIESNTLDVFVRLLRSKIETPGEPKLIQTVRGVGYALRGEPA
jgi:DNA-binding response OmpR family regulator